MVDLDFAVESVEVASHAATPLLLFKLLVSNQTPAIPVRNVQLRCQLRIEPTRRCYNGKEQELLSDLFGEPSRWGQTLRGFLWTYASAQIPGFDTTCTVDLPVPCSYDFNIAATKYFHGLAGGEVLFSLLFSGSVFYSEPDGRLQIDQIPWTKETSFRLPVSIWQSMMEHYYPTRSGSVWTGPFSSASIAINGRAAWRHGNRRLMNCLPAQRWRREHEFRHRVRHRFRRAI